ncbi:hypothetical protein SISNIDRAFT_406569 [Sistotremastrum niveocremeum HHB9708]|uniref:UspA domain-containing protein n=1 Tax=Sistotremastrum niveocremeum HHB9708 TaxID=1314777 RepID=A0A164YE61_9AGAM|nr:hypothetical protein SISNIDRAFT_406569 [Sistotremastrum niveocremeum HHB9708]
MPSSPPPHSRNHFHSHNPNGTLRSALKHPSRPTTPNPSATSPTPNNSSLPLLSPSPSPSNLVSPISSGIPITPINSSTPSSTAGAGAGAGTVTSGYTPKVSFDTFENPSDQALFSLTLQVKSEHYTRTRSTRVFLCAASDDESGKECLDWCIESLVQDSDELIVLRGFDQDELDTPESQSQIRDSAKDLLHQIQSQILSTSSTTTSPPRRISLIVEFVAGKITNSIERLIALYRPDSLVVGTRGQTGVMHSWGNALGGVGSVSKWCLSHSPVPVIVVRPERKVRKTIEKRRADPKRGSHFDGYVPHSLLHLNNADRVL